MLLTLKLRNMVSDILFAQKQAALEEQLALLDQGLNQSSEELVRAKASAVNAVRFMRGARERFLVGSVYEKREIAQALGLSYRFDRGAVTIETHPALMPHLLQKMAPLSVTPSKRRSRTSKMGVKCPKSGTFETRNISSGSHKKAAFAAASPFGGAETTRSETEQSSSAQSNSDPATKRLYCFFRDLPPFRAVSCVA